ncbi:MAG TPA: hypothetical protein VG675_04240 [Bryobacteraceae bacterium]|nr:hypothetical protein [Bryobacteraceae bacterium]
MMAEAIDFSVSPELKNSLGRWRTRAAIIGVIGLALTAFGWVQNPGQFYHSYLWSYVFYIGLAGGCLAWLMTQFLTGGAWGLVIRRPSEAAVRTYPLLILLFVPIIIGIPTLYKWSNPAVLAADEVLRAKQPFLNVPFFLIRAAAYLGGFLFCALYINRWSKIEDRDGGVRPRRKMAKIAAPGLVFWGFAVTFMAIDWVMSLDPHWYSTMFGLLFVAGQGLSGMAFLITILVILSYFRPFSEVLTPRHLHDLGKLLLACVMVWAYFAFSQLLIVWTGNLPIEIPWYLERFRGGWGYIGLVLVFGHFALPFALLLSRDLKRNFKLLACIAMFILLMRYVDLYWLVAPDYLKASFGISWMDFTAPIGLGGVWVAYFLTELGKRPLIPVNDPYLEEGLEHGRQ